MTTAERNVAAYADRAERGARPAEFDRAVVLAGRQGVFSAGFDLQVPAPRPEAAPWCGRVSSRPSVLSFRRRWSCTGHAIAGRVPVVSGDYRLGAAGGYKITANEVAIGLTMPRAAVEILRQRLAPAYFNRAVTIAEPFSPDNAVGAGFLDQVVDAPELPSVARAIAMQLTGLDMAAHKASKLRARMSTLAAVRAGIDADYAAFRARA
jgi:enoyl-CoA hydratase